MAFRRICVLGVAVGGQGGHTFADWLCYTAEAEGVPAIGRGKPAAAQRGGSVDFYIEIQLGSSSEDDEPPIFLPEPMKGHIDLLIGGEFLELARAVKDGYAGQNCKIVGTSSRWFTTAEKLPLRGELLTYEAARDYIKSHCANSIIFDATALARRNLLPDVAANAILLGALAASGFLPFKKESFLEGIRTKGEAVEANIKAFETGYEHVQSGAYRHDEPLPLGFTPHRTPYEQLKLSSEQRSFIEAAESEDSELGACLKEALCQLNDYQDIRYCSSHLRQVREIFEWDAGQRNGFALTKEFARILALRMTYEDAIRVAQEKTRKERLAWIFKEHRKEGSIVKVHEVLGPDLEELYGLLPYGLVAPFVRRLGWEERPSGKTLTMTLETTSLLGYFLLRFLVWLKPLRPRSYRFVREHRLIEEWVEAVKRFAALDYELGLLIAESGEMVRGYGQTRHKTMQAWQQFLRLVGTLAEREDIKQAKDEARQMLSLFFSGPDGSEKVQAYIKQRITDFRFRQDLAQPLAAHSSAD